MLLSRDSQVGLLQLLSVHSVLEQRQVVEGLLLVEIASSFGKLCGEGTKHIVNAT